MTEKLSAQIRDSLDRVPLSFPIDFWADEVAKLEHQEKSSRYQISRAIAQLESLHDPDTFDGNDEEIEHLDDLIGSVIAQLRAYLE